ncbi:MAG: AAA family ATPase [Lachnospiraceae bacterium]|nr:AAA family ATPase [Lachnospiraceae bacterium]
MPLDFIDGNARNTGYRVSGAGDGENLRGEGTKLRRRFNITGLCVPEKHYMVDMTERVNAMKALVDEGVYFTINRARQYGKTTTLNSLVKRIADEYLVVSMDFQAIGSGSFEDEAAFSRAFAALFLREMEDLQEILKEGDLAEVVDELTDFILKSGNRILLIDLFGWLLKFCKASAKPVVLIIDEVDSAANNQVFLDFLGQLRNYYLARDKKGIKTFQSVVLAGVYDIKNLRRKIRPGEEHKVNSPWNVAIEFKGNMSFTKKDIVGMLREYEEDRHTGMDVDEMAGLLSDYTAGYPFLVSRLCKLMDEEVGEDWRAGVTRKVDSDWEAGATGGVDSDWEAGVTGEGNSDGKDSDRESGGRRMAWTREGFFAAERVLLAEKNTLFESLTGKLQDYPELNEVLKSILFTGTDIAYNADQPVLDMATMFGFIVNKNGIVAIANRIFETRLYNFYLSEASVRQLDIYRESQRQNTGGGCGLRKYDRMGQLQEPLRELCN